MATETLTEEQMEAAQELAEWKTRLTELQDGDAGIDSEVRAESAVIRLTDYLEDAGINTDDLIVQDPDTREWRVA
ncbi:hypothetical protein QEH42_gp115 [Microbacterium phage Pumpernickel]|uniref:Uncharacterized protein n=1 Tax=Microbacterium phage Pumpernickel TaxID=2885983 RepID=A0AAE9C2E5_9CAUD|nr:hypothetical protein QEH42_gp052 [Microbacterium phage Pumpernickel]YP_010755343.1 hypothetical protein QEH42_gp115 [Microbacterium phage Pumpernickel]UDL15843.1 hypothetical protein SEA_PUMPERNICKEL_52 [Microbacterium phage Pumpernickel]UDL16103.1 hypothetical protein SEA_PUMPERNICKEL_353 [Microbacterium phage Pumpernickel]